MLLSPTATDMRTSLLNSDGAPVTKMTTWSNALATNYPLTPNLLSPSTAYVTYVDRRNGNDAQFQSTNLGAPYDYNDASALLDGSATPPSTPWVAWDYIYYQVAIDGPYAYSSGCVEYHDAGDRHHAVGRPQPSGELDA